jgi:RNA polymerase sigma factor for flagellar operon FliA
MIREVWNKYWQDKDEESRKKLIIHYIPLVKNICHRVPTKIPYYLDQEDMQSFGLMGLIKAIDKFDPEYGVKFETYARYRIRGAIIDEIRKANWLPRSLFQKIQIVSEVYQKAEQIGLYQTEEEVAAAADLTVEELHEVMVSTSHISFFSLDEFVGGGDKEGYSPMDVIAATDTVDPENMVELVEMKNNLARAIDKMNEKDKLVLAMYYNEKLTLKEIGQVIGVSESRVSQIHGRAILRLKALMGELGYA